MRHTLKNHANSTSNENCCSKTTLYHPRKADDHAVNWEKTDTLKEGLAERNNKTPFVTCIPLKCDGKK